MIYLVRGLPGAGKSTFAKKLALKYNARVFENDDFFTRDGVYTFDETQYGQACDACFFGAQKVVAKGHSAIVANCFISKNSLLRYVRMAKDMHSDWRVYHVYNKHGGQSIHARANAEDIIESMADSMCVWHGEIPVYARPGNIFAEGKRTPLRGEDARCYT